MPSGHLKSGKGKKMKRSILLVSVFMLAIVLCQPAYAADDFAGPWEKFSVYLGGFGAASDSSVRIGTNALGAGLDIDVEDALGMSTSQGTVRLGALYRLGEKRRHRIGLNYFAFNREGTAVAKESHTIGDIQIGVGDTLTTTYNTSIIKADYAYSFFMDERFNLAVSGGLFIMPIELGVSIDSGGSFESSETNITAPLPVIGLSMDFAFSPKWVLKQNFQWFYLEIDNFTGAISDVNIALEWNVWKHWGFGLGLDSFRMQVEAADDSTAPGVDFVGNIKMNYAGVMLYARYRF